MMDMDSRVQTTLQEDANDECFIKQADQIAWDTGIGTGAPAELVSRVFNNNHSSSRDAGDDLSGFSYELRHAHKIVRDMMSDAHRGINAPFVGTVDRCQLIEDMDDYREVIKRSIWLGKIKEKLFGKAYDTITAVITDVRLMFENCYRYHGPDSPYTKKGLKLEQVLEQKLALLPREIRDKTTLLLTYGHTGDDDLGTRRRSARHNLDYTSVILNNVRNEKALRSKEQKKKHTEVKKAEREVKEKEVIEWENCTLLAEPIMTQMRSMWELPLIGHFLFLCQTALNLHEVSIYELERVLVMPRASTLLPRIMTSLLSNPQQRLTLDRKPAMPFKVWQNRLQGRVQSWYKILQARDNRADLVFQQLGIEADFFQIMGAENPLLEKRFHELTFHQRVWLVKSLCDYIVQSHKTIQDTLNEQPVDDMREYVLGSDSDGNAYLHFPQFCGLDLRIYRQSKTFRVPAACRWGAGSSNKRKSDACDVDSNLEENVKKARTETPELCSVLPSNSDSASSTPLPKDTTFESSVVSSVDPPVQQDVKKFDTKQQLVDSSDRPPTLEDETTTVAVIDDHDSTVSSPKPPVLEIEVNADSKTSDSDFGSSRPPSSRDETESSVNKRSGRESVSRRMPPNLDRDSVASGYWNTRRSLRLTAARLGVDYKASASSSSSSSSSDVKSDESWVGDSETDDDDDDDDDGGGDHGCMTGDENGDDLTNFETEEEETSSEPDIKKFELIVDSVEGLRKLRDNFTARIESVKSDSQPPCKSGKLPPKYRGEVKLRDRLSNLLVELEPWEPKLTKATQRLRLKLKREWDDFKDREEEVDEDMWDSDKDSVYEKSTELHCCDEKTKVDEADHQSLDFSARVPVKASGDDDVNFYSLWDDVGEYRTRGRVRQLKQNATLLNGSRSSHSDFIRSHAQHNTASQAKELYAWETLRQILVPSGASVPSDGDSSSAANIGTSRLAAKVSNCQSPPAKKSLSKAEVDILGAINAATSMAKRQEPQQFVLNNIKKSVRATSVVAAAKTGRARPGSTGFLLHIPTATSTNSCRPAAAVSATLSSVPSVTASSSNFGATNNRRLDPSHIPTKQQLSELTSIAENTQNLRGILDGVKRVSGDTRQVPSSTATAAAAATTPTTLLLSIKAQDGTSVYYQLGPSQVSTEKAGSTQLSSDTTMMVAMSPSKTNSAQLTTGSPPKLLVGSGSMPSAPTAPGQQLQQQQQAVLVPVSNHQGQTVFIRLPSGGGLSASPPKANFSTALVLPQPPPLEPIRPPPKPIRQVCYRPVPSTLSAPRLTNCVSSVPSVTAKPQTVVVSALSNPPKFAGISATSSEVNNKVCVAVKPADLLTKVVPKSANIPTTAATSSNIAAAMAASAAAPSRVSSVANLTALLSSNRSIAAAVQKLTATGHKVVISQQANGNVVLQASSKTPPSTTMTTIAAAATATVAPPVVMGVASVSPKQVVAKPQQPQPLPTPTTTAVQRRPPSMLSTVRAVIGSPPVTLPVSSAAAIRAVPSSQQPPAAVMLQPSMPKIVAVQQQGQQQQPGSPAKTSIKSKLVVLHDPSTKKQSFGLLLENGQILPVNTTLSIANNSSNNNNNNFSVNSSG